MDFLKDAFSRTDLRQLRNFLLNGAEELDGEEQPFRDRLEKGCMPMFARLDEVYTDRSERDRAAADLS